MDPLTIGTAAIIAASGSALVGVLNAYREARKGMQVVVRFDKGLVTEEPLTDAQARSIVEEVLAREPSPSGL